MNQEQPPTPAGKCNNWPSVEGLCREGKWKQALRLVVAAVIKHSKVLSVEDAPPAAVEEAIRISAMQYASEGGYLVSRGYYRTRDVYDEALHAVVQGGTCVNRGKHD